MKKIFLVLSILLSVCSTTSLAQTNTTTVVEKATATLASSCLMSTQNVSFGAISLPVSTQSATSSMTIQCTKGSSYTVGLAYGGIYGQAPNSTPYYKISSSVVQGGVLYTNILAYNSSNVQTSTFLVRYPACACIDGFSPEIAASTGNSITYNSATNQFINNSYSTGYAYGKMTGVASGDSIAYAIAVPGNPSEVWNTGNSSYATTGTGSNQSLPIVATLVPSQTASRYPSADSYSDVVTATLNF